jgi:hypothetical protein
MNANDASPTVVFSDRPSRAWRVGLGVLTTVAGILLLVWPDAAVLTVAVIAGVLRAVTAVTQKMSAVIRALYLFLGLLLVVVGILCLCSPFHAVTILMFLFGLSWVVNGGVELFHGATGGGGWTTAAGAVSLVAGVVVLAYPTPSARVMIWLFGLTLVATGVMIIIGATVRPGRPKRHLRTL